MKKILIVMGLSCMMSFGLSWAAYADDITADMLTYDGKSKVATAVGNVVIHADEGAVITGSRGEYHFDDKSVMITGNVHYEKNGALMDAQTVYLYGDKTLKGVGFVTFNDPVEKRVLKGDEVIYNRDTGYGKITGNGYFESEDGIVEAPYLEGNLKGIYISATGGVTIVSPVRNMTGSADTAVYTRSGKDGTDGKLVLSGNAHAVQNGNTFDGPELVIYDTDKVVETTGRSTIVITQAGDGKETNTAQGTMPALRNRYASGMREA